ncbi:MAG TPA: DnaD domain protein [Desulfosporosinus sp.]|nr:DnaD domain protein [Desulfosporosinus sp.]
MAWIESNQEVGRHPKTKKLARLLDISVVTAVGHLHYFWWWALDFAQDGVLTKFDDCDIAEACMWEGDVKIFVDSLIEAGFIDKNESVFCIHDWYEYAGRLIERRQSDADRKRGERDKRKKASNKALKKRTSDGCPADVQGKSTDVLRNRTLPYPTVPNLITNNNNNARESENVTEMIETEPEELAVDMDIPPDNVMAIGTQAINWAEKNWGRMIPKGEADSIIAWCDEFLAKGCKEPDAVIIEGLRVCLEVDVRKLNYLNAVLTDWREAGVLSVDHVKTREAERKNQKEHKRNKDPGDKAVGKTDPSKFNKFYL